MADAPLLSVVIPTHNVAAWIGETLTSVLDQDVADMEVIVVDDHSEDDTVRIVERRAAADPRLRLVAAGSRGGGTARNDGVAVAAGRYLVFCDGDDLVPAGAYSALVGSLEASGSDVAVGDFLKFSPSDTWRPTESMPAYGRPGRGRSITDEPTLLLARPCWNKAYRRSFWDDADIRFPDVPRSNDIVPVVRGYTLASAIDIIPDVVYLYRERPGATSMSARAVSPESMLSYLEQERECARLIAAQESSQLSAVYRRLIWDRDTFIHVGRYVLQHPAAHPLGEQVATALRELLDLTGDAPDTIPPLKRVVLEFASQQRWAAAAAAARWQLDAPTSVSPIELVRDFLMAVAAQGDQVMMDDKTLWRSVRELQNVGNSRADAAAWRAAAAALAALPGEDRVTWISEVGSAEVALDRIPDLRDAVDGDVLVLRGGRELQVVGTSRVGGAEAQPVLWAADAPCETFRPHRVTWTRTVDADGAERWAWDARFRRSDLPIHRHLQPALEMTSTSTVVSVLSRIDLPEYSVMDSFVFERHGTLVVAHRRRSRIYRAARRAAIIARDRVRSRLQRRPPVSS